MANAGLRGLKCISALKEMSLPQGLTINTFGYGVDHDSKQLQEISLASKGGVYHYIENVESIAATFGESLAGLVSTIVHNVDVKLIAEDGCRIVNFYTKFPITELKSVKEYVVSFGTMYSLEQRSLLFKISLRKLDHALFEHRLLKVIAR